MQTSAQSQTFMIKMQFDWDLNYSGQKKPFWKKNYFYSYDIFFFLDQLPSFIH